MESRVSTVWIPLAKGCGQLLNFNCTLIVVPVLTEFMTWLNQARIGDKSIDKWVPLGKNIT